MSDQVTNYDGRQSSHIHVWFELSYAHYLVLPRSLMQAMPVEWQARMVECLREMMEATRKLELNDKYEVLLRGERGLIVDDPYREYRRPVIDRLEVPKCQSR